MTTMSEDGDRNAQLAELQRLALVILDYKQRSELTSQKLVHKFPAIGSDSTLSKFAKADPEKLREHNLDRWLLDYRTVVAQIESIGSAEQGAEEIYEDLAQVQALRVAVSDAMKENGNNRLVLMLGPSGSGKTRSGKIIQKLYTPKRVVFVEANVTWQNGLSPMLDDLLAALNVPAPESKAAKAKFNTVVAALNAKRLCLIIDEGHHMNPACLNLLKSLMNQSPGEFVVLAMKTLFRRLESGAYEEARQLTQNRLFERIQIMDCELADIGIYVERRTGIVLEKGMRLMLQAESKQHGHMSFIRLVCKQALRLARDSGEKIDAEHIARAAAKVKTTR